MLKNAPDLRAEIAAQRAEAVSGCPLAIVNTTVCVTKKNVNCK